MGGREGVEWVSGWWMGGEWGSGLIGGEWLVD